MTRKIVQIAVSPDPDATDGVYALCDDGTLWMGYYDICSTRQWQWSRIDTSMVTGVDLPKQKGARNAEAK